jgi:hypothetical protein
MMRKIAAVLLGVLALLVAIVATRPSHFHVERSMHMAAPASLVFANIDDFHAWAAWSPWERLDPDMKKDYTGAPHGVGAAYAWSGNDQVGVGNMRILESRAPEHVQIQLEFEEPWKATNLTTFSIKPDPGGSQVVWGMDGESNFMFKAVGLFMDMDATVGKDFERGLSTLRGLAETLAAREAQLAEQAAEAAAARAPAQDAPPSGTQPAAAVEPH